MGVVKFTISMDEHIYERLKEEAESSDDSISSTVSGIVAQYLGLFPQQTEEPPQAWRLAIEARIEALEKSMTASHADGHTKKLVTSGAPIPTQENLITLNSSELEFHTDISGMITMKAAIDSYVGFELSSDGKDKPEYDRISAQIRRAIKKGEITKGPQVGRDSYINREQFKQWAINNPYKPKIQNNSE